MGVLTDPLHMTLLSDDGPARRDITAEVQTARTRAALEDLDARVESNGGTSGEVTQALRGDERAAEWLRLLGVVFA